MFILVHVHLSGKPGNVREFETSDWRHPNSGILGLQKLVKIVLFSHVK